MTSPTQTVQAPARGRAAQPRGRAREVSPQAAVTVHPLGLGGHGPGVLRAVLDDLIRAFPDLLVTTGQVITTGDVVTALIKVEGTQSADYAAPSTRRSTSTSTRRGGSP